MIASLVMTAVFTHAAPADQPGGQKEQGFIAVLKSDASPAEKADDATPAPKKGELITGDKATIEPPDESLVGVPGKILQGEIDALRFLEFIAQYRGAPVVYDSDAFRTPKVLNIVSDMTATYEIAKAILQVNKFNVY